MTLEEFSLAMLTGLQRIFSLVRLPIPAQHTGEGGQASDVGGGEQEGGGGAGQEGEHTGEREGDGELVHGGEGGYIRKIYKEIAGAGGLRSEMEGGGGRKGEDGNCGQESESFGSTTCSLITGVSHLAEEHHFHSLTSLSENINFIN